MEYTISGQGDKAIIFLHGWGGGYESFSGAADALGSRFTCANVSFFNEIEREPLTLDDYARFVENIVIELKTARKCSYVTVVGHSFGGRVGVRLAACNLIDRLMLVDAAGLKPRRGVRYCARRVKRAFSKIFNLKLDCGSADYKALTGARRRTFVNIVNTFQESELKHIAIPVLIFWGDKDKETPMYMAKRFKRKIKDSAIITVKGGGHFSYLDDYKSFMAAVNSFASI